MFGLAEVFKESISEIGLEIYFNALAEFSIDEVSVAVSAVVKKRVYNGIPKPAEIIEAITGGENVKALMAWDEVLSSARRSCKKHADPDIENAVRLCGGWHKLGMTLEEDLHWVKKEFIEAFKDVGHCAYRSAIDAPKKLNELLEGIGINPLCKKELVENNEICTVKDKGILLTKRESEDYMQEQKRKRQLWKEQQIEQGVL